MRDESRRLLDRRRMEAKNTVRRYVDDVSFQVGKQSRDMLRQVHRELRDHFMARSEELVRSAQQSLNAAERALRAVALGGKNLLFAGWDRGGESAAAVYRLIGTKI